MSCYFLEFSLSAFGFFFELQLSVKELIIESFDAYGPLFVLFCSFGLFFLQSLDLLGKFLDGLKVFTLLLLNALLESMNILVRLTEFLLC